MVMPKQNQHRTLTLCFLYPAEVSDVSPRLKIAALQCNEFTLQTTCSLDPLLKLAARYEIVDLETRRQTLEELFLHYYGKEQTV